jgi:hypothetical protein
MSGTSLLVGQQWWLNVAYPTRITPNDSNISFLLRLPHDLDGAILADVLQDVWIRQDALRARFIRAGGIWEQHYLDDTYPVPFREVDLRTVPSEAKIDVLNGVVNEFDRSLDLRTGPLARFVLFWLGGDEPPRMLVVVHHLAMDAASSIILRQLISASYAHRLAARTEPKTSPASYRQCVQAMNEYARSDSMKEELAFWTGQPWEQFAGLPSIGPTSELALRREIMETVRIPAVTSPQTSRFAGVGMQDVVISALGDVFTSWAGGPMSLCVVHNGRSLQRNDAPGRMILPRAVMRTVGLFAVHTTMFVPYCENPRSEKYLRAALDGISAVPSSGAGFEILRWLGAPEVISDRVVSRGLEPQIFVHYARHPTGSNTGGQAMGFSFDKRIPIIKDYFYWQPRLRIRLLERDGELRITVDFDPRQFETEQMRKTVAVYKETLLHYFSLVYS